MHVFLESGMDCCWLNKQKLFLIAKKNEGQTDWLLLLYAAPRKMTSNPKKRKFHLWHCPRRGGKTSITKAIFLLFFLSSCSKAYSSLVSSFALGRYSVAICSRKTCWVCKHFLVQTKGRMELEGKSVETTLFFSWNICWVDLTRF